MFIFFHNQEKQILSSVLSKIMVVVLSLSLVFAPSAGYAQVLNLPVPGTMVGLSPAFNAPIMIGMTLFPDNPLKFDFIIDTGDDHLQGEALQEETQKLINYFMATLTVPEDEMWVNLSPYEKDRIIADGLSQTEMGRDMLVQDYMLKQLTASLMYPEEELGEKFWKTVYQKSKAKFGTTEIPTNTFNKVWIVPDEAAVYIHGNNVFVNRSHLKVMLEEDYLALESNQGTIKHGVGDVSKDDLDVMNQEAKQIIREILIPEIEKEVNEGKNFANLRQIYNSMILATWYRKNLKESILDEAYVGKNKTDGIELEDKQVKEKIYNQYVEAFKKGVYNFIKEDYDKSTQQIVPRKYFSGGLQRAAIVDADPGLSPLLIGQVNNGNPKAVGRVEGKTLTSSPVRSTEAFSSPIKTTLYGRSLLDIAGVVEGTPDPTHDGTYSRDARNTLVRLIGDIVPIDASHMRVLGASAEISGVLHYFVNRLIAETEEIRGSVFESIGGISNELTRNVYMGDFKEVEKALIDGLQNDTMENSGRILGKEPIARQAQAQNALRSALQSGLRYVERAKQQYKALKERIVQETSSPIGAEAVKKQVEEFLLKDLTVEYKYSIKAEKYGDDVIVEVTQINRNSPSLLPITIRQNYQQLINGFPEGSWLIPLWRDDEFSVRFKITTNNEKASSPLTKLEQGLENLREIAQLDEQYRVVVGRGDLVQWKQNMVMFLRKQADKLFEEAIRRNEKGARRNVTALWSVVKQFEKEADIADMFEHAKNLVDVIRANRGHLASMVTPMQHKIIWDMLNSIEPQAVGIMAKIIEEKRPELLSSSPVTPGGIDFNPNNVNIGEQGDKVQINFSSSPLQNLDPNSVNGILPVIINITPLPSVLPLLGLEPGRETEDYIEVSWLN